MKIYVAGKNMERAQAMMDRLQDEGHTISYDWIEGLGPHEDKVQRALEERDAVLDSDALVYLWESDQESARYEAGMAMALDIPTIVVRHSSFFFTLPNVQVVSCDEEVPGALRRIGQMVRRSPAEG